MINSDVIVVGAGPAGSTCAWKLKQAGASVLLLDKVQFPRLKLCAGWVTPGVLADLELTPDTYPHSLSKFRHLHISIKGVKLPVPTRQYAIRRIELDDWLVKRSGVELHHHEVREIKKEKGDFIIDHIFRCKYLVGAGGTGCPVYKTFFMPSIPRLRQTKITTLEEEFPYPITDSRCYLWFFDHGLPGYSWYVPKEGGYVNIGIGGKFSRLKQKGKTIRAHWNLFIEKLEGKSLVKRAHYAPKGHNYYLNTHEETVEFENAFIIGDAAGIATVDMGEGIGPAVKSGMWLAESIINNTPFSLRSLEKYSFKEILLPWVRS